MTYESCSEECPEWDEEVAAGDASQVKQGVGDAGTGKDAEEAHLLHQMLHTVLCPLKPRHLLGIFQFLLEFVEFLLLL